MPNTTTQTAQNNTTSQNSIALSQFTDINSNEWYYNAVKYCVENGLMSGTSTKTFEPNSTATRAMIITILWRIENKPIVDYTMNFTDVAENMYYRDAVLWAVREGIISGYNAQTFAPNDNITREQMATILYRYAQYKGKDVSTAQNTILNYQDINNISSYATNAVKWACNTGILNGTSDTALSPKESTTRAEVAQILKIYLQ